MSDEKDMATKESLFSLIERIESTLEDKISELEEQIAKSISITQFKVEKEKLWERINQLDEEFYKKTEELENTKSQILTEMANIKEKTKELEQQYKDLKLPAPFYKELIDFEKEISELKEFIDRVFEVSNEDGKRIEELKEQVEDNRLAIDIVKNLTIPHENREVLRDICYINIEGPNHMNESEMYNAYERILDKLSGEMRAEGNSRGSQSVGESTLTMPSVPKSSADSKPEQPDYNIYHLTVIIDNKEDFYSFLKGHEVIDLIKKIEEAEEKPKDICSNCGRLNDMCGVFLRTVNLCDECASVVMEILFETKILVEKEDLKEMKHYLQLLNSYIDHHTNDFAANGYYENLMRIIEKYEGG